MKEEENVLVKLLASGYGWEIQVFIKGSDKETLDRIKQIDTALRAEYPYNCLEAIKYRKK